MDDIRGKAIEKLASREKVSLIAHKRTQFWNEDKETRAVCVASKQYRTGYYWYAFHPHQLKFLSEGKNSFFVLGCLDHSNAYAIPLTILEQILPLLHKTEKEERSYWHIHLQPLENGEYQFVVPGSSALSLEQFKLRL